MANNVGRPSKIDKETMKVTNVWFIIMIIILLILLSITTLSIVTPEVIDNLKATIINVFK